MWKTFLGTLGLLLGGVAGLAAFFFGVGSLVMLSSGVVVVLPLLGAVMGVLAGWRLDKRKNAGDRGHHRTWKSILGTLGWPLGGLAGVAALRALCIYGQTRFSEADLVDYLFMPLSAAIVVLALLGAGMGQIVGVLVGRRLDKRLNTEDRRHHSRHRLTAVCVVGGAAIVGLALGAYCCTFVVRTLSGPPDLIHLVILEMRLDAEPDQAGTVVSELLRIGESRSSSATSTCTALPWRLPRWTCTHLFAVIGACVSASADFGEGLIGTHDT